MAITEKSGLSADDTIPPCERVKDTARILEAMRLGVRDALIRHKQAGVAVATWREGRVVLIDPAEIRIDPAPPEPPQAS